MKILTVDDSRTMRRIISDICTSVGYDVMEAEHGDAALKVLQAHPGEIDLILMDWNMPGMNGLEVLQRIKATPEWKHIPVMMVTTEGEKSYIVRAVQAGAIHYVTKPFSQQKLANTILEAVGQGSYKPSEQNS
ncbi:MAG: response regulator [Magnetococcales bacterium]|nr:response regulator [Magnetococcales bacterium]